MNLTRISRPYSRLKNPKLYLMILGDAVLFAAAHLLSYGLRFEFSPPASEIEHMLAVLPWFVPLKTFVFAGFGLYRGMWRYTSIRDFWRLASASLFSMMMGMAALLVLYRFHGYSRAVFLLDGVLTFLLTGTMRLLIRSYFSSLNKRMPGWATSSANKKRRRVLIIGAGDAGEKILREVLENDQLSYDVVGFVDDDLQKQGRSIHGIPVLGPVDRLPQLLKKMEIEEALIAIPSATGEQMRRVVGVCKSCEVAYKTLPGLGEIIDGRVSMKVLRDVSYQDLLGRPPVHLDITGIKSYLYGKTVMITGCGGSIGSELCRQVVRFQPRFLVLLDASEANLFHIQMQLHNEVGFHDYQAVLGDIQDGLLMNDIFRRYRPHVVFHAAAYKHVPMLEKNPWEAVFNNIGGSRILMETALAHKTERFVLVSTDKAVRPTNVMGASKRATELLLQAFQGNGTRFMAVRFGNVVGSSGSVVPLFRRQIEQGGPITVTHPEVTRYFMTIPEAAQLIIQAGAMGEGGEVFILEMGTPVRIADMARDLIRLSGKEPDRDVRIIYTGLRAGEKLYEELITTGEGIVATTHEKIMALRSDDNFHGGGGGMNLDQYREWLDCRLEELYTLAGQRDAKAIKEKLKEIAPEYTPQATESVL